jgi:hypothetical protein
MRAFESSDYLEHRLYQPQRFYDVDADQAELDEIYENLIRAALTPAEEAAHLGARDGSV